MNKNDRHLNEVNDINLIDSHLNDIETFPHTTFSFAADRFIRRIGELVSYIWVALIAVIIINVLSRHLLGQGRVEFEEIQWHFYAIGFLVGLSYCYVEDSHVRVDIFFERMSMRTKAKVELFGILFFLMPFIYLVVYYAFPFVANSWATNEVSDAPGGLPQRWFIKSFLITSFSLLGLAAISRLSKVTSFLYNYPKVKA